MNKLIFIIIVPLLLAAGYFALKPAIFQNHPKLVDATIYKSPSCGCCVSHNAYLKKNNFTTEIKAVGDIQAIKSKYRILANMQSCHTAVFDNYFVEGHVPIEAINKLLAEKPEIDGIALPGMLSGSPGMPGPKTEEWIIYALKDGVATEFMRL